MISYCSVGVLWFLTRDFCSEKSNTENRVDTDLRVLPLSEQQKAAVHCGTLMIVFELTEDSLTLYAPVAP